MQSESSHDSRRRERVAPNLYRRSTQAGERFDVVFRDTDGRKRFKALRRGRSGRPSGRRVGCWRSATRATAWHPQT